MNECVVCAVDRTEAARGAASVAARLAEALDLDLVLLSVVEAEPALAVAASPYSYVPPSAPERSVEAARQLLDGLADDVAASVSVERCVELGEPARRISELAERKSAALTVLGTRGRGRVSAAILGSVSAATISRSPRSVMVVPERSQLKAGRPIVCAVDDSPAARSATRFALWLSVRLGAELVVAHAIAHSPAPSASAAPGVPDRLAELDRREGRRFLMRLALEEGLGVEVERRVTHGNEAESVRTLAEAEDASLVVVGTRRHGSLRSALVGSISHDVRSKSARPVLVVPAGARIPIRS